LGAWERLLEAIRGVEKLSLLLLEFPSSSMERMMGYEIEGGDANGRRN